MMPYRLAVLTGEWAGTNRLRMTPAEPYAESAAACRVASVAGGNLLSFTYAWSDRGAPQDGLLLLGVGEKPDEFAAVWVDSWHQSPQWMMLRGTADHAGVVRLSAGYGDGWGWAIELDPSGGDELRVGMDNTPPGEQPHRVVEISCRRVPSGGPA